jgi:hypothetical protein
MNRPLQGNAGPEGRPLCFNREPRREYVANDGYDLAGALRTKTIPWAFSEDCKSWIADPSTDPVPLLEGWKCEGCHRFPHEAVQTAVFRSLTRD